MAEVFRNRLRCCGTLENRVVDHMIDGFIPGMDLNIPRVRIGTGDDTAKLTCWLASKEAFCTTAHNLAPFRGWAT